MKTDAEYKAASREARRSTRERLDAFSLDKGYRRRTVLAYENARGEFKIFDDKTGDFLAETTVKEVEVMTAGELAEQYDDDDLGLEI